MPRFAKHIPAVVIVTITLIGGSGLVLAGDSTSTNGYRVDGSFTTMKFAMGRLIVTGHGQTMINLKTGHLWITGFKKAVYWEGSVDEYCSFQRRDWLVYVAETQKRMADKSPSERASIASWVLNEIADNEERLRRMGLGDGKDRKSVV